MLLKPMDDSLQMEKILLEHSGTTVNMSRCQKQEKKVLSGIPVSEMLR